MYLAHDLRLRTKVALKETLFSTDNTAYRRAFEQEAQILARLRHQALPKVIDHFIEGNGQFLVMEFIPGEDLGNQLTRFGKRFASPQVFTWVLKWADQLLDVLHYLHTRPSPVFHRDIKPKNLKLSPNTYDIFLLDFGLARGGLTVNAEPFDGAATTTPENMARKVYGFTPPYAPAEQINNMPPDPRSDLYSLAATLYHMLTGTLPADAMGRMARYVNGQPDSLRPIRSIAPHVPEAIARVFEHALEVSAEARPQTAQEMREALTQARRQSERNGNTPSAIAPPPTSRSTEIATPRANPGITPALTPVTDDRDTQPVGTLVGRLITGSPVRDIAFSPDGTTLAAGYDDHTIGLWRVDSGLQLATLQGHASSVRSVAFSPDGALLATGSDDETVRIWNVQSSTLQLRIPCPGVSVESVAFSPDGTILAIGGWGRSITLCNSTNGRFEKFGDLPCPFVHSLSFAPDSAFLAAGGYDGTLYLWRTADHQADGKIEGFSNFIYSVAFSPDGALLAASSQTQVRIWRTSDRRQIETFQYHSRPVHSLAFSPDGALLATGSEDGTVRFRHVSSGVQLTYVFEQSAGVTAIRYSPDGRIIAAATHDGRIFLWRAPQ